ncbi:GNAT family N-acetyltransferase [Nitratireductor pacificus]|uniref:Putative acetyltransferase n=1 Tax=Nitratireductor pacificus pht-3B TaxID=391937 RepID=K2M6I7_9HYPH|nr:GNAT family N-acetyltransferase [Nitratireductor pacificus]EKF17771.1 putative acetyltransferase [Nitratireductor pacificus pht-3B]
MPMNGDAGLWLRPFGADDLSILREWFRDRELSRRLSYPTDAWFAHIQGPKSQCWIVCQEDGQAIAAIQVDREDDGVGFIDLAVKPDLRGKGIGTASLRHFLQTEAPAFRVLSGSIEPDNRASIGCAQKAGFVVADALDDDGLLPVIWTRD